ncbi:MFS transporter [Ruania alba]|uniref:MFS transporter, DHA2 family, multidrug resistance protein n=1 Tax=Ruania alba TaxID=648782 RepID=A0A1H5CH33_9MICO|nr:MFS transporter [Ruania alba]SED65724.1 MFS transporter, DHA2 family, multidrug resistance protein [Ruania alba]
MTDTTHTPVELPPQVDANPLGKRARWAALVVLMLPVLLVAIDNTVLNFALPQISEALRPSGTQLLWAIDIYPLVLAGLLVPMGATADRFGRRRMLMIGSAGFAAVSLLAAYAPSIEVLIGARALLGFFGAMLMPSTLSLLRHVFTDRDERRTAIAVWAAGFGAGAALGPIVGGFLLEHAWWGSVFLIAVPVLVLLLLLAPVFLPESGDRHARPIDLASVVLVLVAMTSLVLAIKTVAKDGVTTLAIGTFAVGLVLGVTFVRRQRRLVYPMIEMSLFRHGAFSGAVAINLLSVFAMVGFLFFASQDLQLVHGLNPMRASLVLVPGVVGTIAAGLLAARLVRRVRPVLVVAGGLLLSASGYLMVAAGDGGTSLGALMAAFVLVAVGVGGAETISNDLILSAVPADKAGAASAISETAYEVGSVLGTAVLGGLLTSAYARNVVLPEGVAAADAQAAGETLGGAVEVARSLPPGQAAELVASAQAAFTSGVGLTSLIGAVLVLVAVGIALSTLRRAR